MDVPYRFLFVTVPPNENLQYRNPSFRDAKSPVECKQSSTLGNKFSHLPNSEPVFWKAQASKAHN